MDANTLKSYVKHVNILQQKIKRKEKQLEDMKASQTCYGYIFDAQVQEIKSELLALHIALKNLDDDAHKILYKISDSSQRRIADQDNDHSICQ